MQPSCGPRSCGCAAVGLAAVALCAAAICPWPRGRPAPTMVLLEHGLCICASRTASVHPSLAQCGVGSLSGLGSARSSRWLHAMGSLCRGPQLVCQLHCVLTIYHRWNVLMDVHVACPRRAPPAQALPLGGFKQRVRAPAVRAVVRYVRPPARSYGLGRGDHCAVGDLCVGRTRR